MLALFAHLQTEGRKKERGRFRASDEQVFFLPASVGRVMSPPSFRLFRLPIESTASVQSEGGTEGRSTKLNGRSASGLKGTEERDGADIVSYVRERERERERN